MPTINLTEKNLELLKAVVEVMKAEIDWEEVAKKADMKTSKYARDQWTVVRNKLVAGEGGGKAAAGKATAGTKRKDSATSTPAPTPKKTKTTKGKKAESRAASEDGDEEETRVKDEEGEDFGLDGDYV